MHEQRNTRTSRTPSLSSHARSNTNASTNPTHSNFFRGASNVQITGTPTFNTIVGGVVVESHDYGPGTIDNLEFGIRFSPSRSSTAHHDSYQSRRSRYDPPCAFSINSIFFYVKQTNLSNHQLTDADERRKASRISQSATSDRRPRYSHKIAHGPVLNIQGRR